MEYLAEYFDVVVPGAGGTRAYRLTKEIPASRLGRAIDYDFKNAEIASLLSQMLSRSPGWPMLDLVFARQLYLMDRRKCRKFVENLLIRKQTESAVAELRRQISLLCPGILSTLRQDTRPSPEGK